MTQSISKPFPNGESLERAMGRMKSFIDDLPQIYDGQNILLIRHPATWYGLEHHINGVSLADLSHHSEFVSTNTR